MATIYEYRTGEFVREATEDEAAKYRAELAAMTNGNDRAIGAVDGAGYGLDGKIVYMEE